MTSLEIALCCLCARVCAHLYIRVLGIRKFAFEVLFVILFSGVKRGSMLTCFFSSFIFFPLSFSRPQSSGLHCCPVLLLSASVNQPCLTNLLFQPAINTRSLSGQQWLIKASSLIHHLGEKETCDNQLITASEKHSTSHRTHSADNHL